MAATDRSHDADVGRIESRLSGPTARKASFAIVATAVILFCASASYGIASPFYYGHYGYHGGSYATWARGTLRHHTLLPINEPGFQPPRPGTYYIHHPVLTHQLVTATFALFGQHEWSVRLGALIPSFLSLLLVTAIAWRNIGPAAGAIASLVFALLPINIWYSVNIDQGFPSIACLLGFFWFYLRWLDSARVSHGLAALGLESLAGGFEWSPYFAFPAIFAHVVWIGARRRGRYLGFALLHPLVVLGPLAAHYLAVSRAGMMNDLLGAYRNRAAEVTYQHFVGSMRKYGETLFGKVVLVVMFAWLLLTILRIIRGRGRAVDLVGLTFAFALLTYVHVFKVAVITHAYRQLYGNVWATLAVADLTTRAGGAIAWLLSRRARPSAGIIGLGVTGALAIAILAATAPVTWAGLIESRAHGGIPGWKTFNPDLRQTAFAAEVNRLTNPGDTLYFHPTFSNPPPFRMDWAFYYDRDLRSSMPLRFLQRLPPAARKHAVAIVLPTSLFGEELRAYAELTRQHPVFLVDDLALLDLRTDRAETRAYTLSAPDPRQGSPATRWLLGPYPWPRLVPNPRKQAALAQLVQLATATPAIAPTTTRTATGTATRRSPKLPFGPAAAGLLAAHATALHPAPTARPATASGPKQEAGGITVENSAPRATQHPRRRQLPQETR